MLYVWQATWRPGITRELQDGALMRRAAWRYPEGLEVKGEYWVQGNPTVISIFEAADVAPIFEMSLVWGDVFDITVNPVVTPEEGLRLGPELMARRPD